MPNENNMPEFHVFYDTETTGAQPRFDQILQTAAILTDADFNEIEEIDVRSRLATHVVPSAGALKVTHVDPYEIARAPYAPHEYAHMLNAKFREWSSKGRTSFDGFNTLNFDEEIVRQMFWENIEDPYITTSKGNTRNDYLHFLRALYARNPEAIEFPIKEDTGKRSFKLELIAPANGYAGHNAHDALGDVRATIFVAQLIRDTDPELYEHMTSMGNANAVRDFVDTNVTFRMLNGAMLNPGALDVCLIASEAANPKSKMTWNLAIDPIPYLDMTAEQILDAMKQKGTPFRSLKCNKKPGVFPLGWEFLNLASSEDYQPADPETIDLRSDIIRDHVDFQKNVAEAMRLRVESYGENETLEEKIYSGFPNWDDKGRMGNFQRESSWDRRLDIVREFEKPELQQLGLRTIYVNAPEVLPDHILTAYRNAIAENRHTLRTDLPWNTVGKLMQEVDEMLAADPNDAEVHNIRKWALETYPQASDWVPGSGARAKEKSKAQEVAPEASETEASTPEVAIEAAAIPTQVASVNFLDGLD
jgi:exodeoxyribonuclease-1